MNVVVLFTSSPCDAHPDMRCVMDVIGPFPTASEAWKVAETFPAWTRAHVMLLTPPELR